MTNNSLMWYFEHHSYDFFWRMCACRIGRKEGGERNGPRTEMVKRVAQQEASRNKHTGGQGECVALTDCGNGMERKCVRACVERNLRRMLEKL